MDAEPL